MFDTRSPVIYLERQINLLDVVCIYYSSLAERQIMRLSFSMDSPKFAIIMKHELFPSLLSFINSIEIDFWSSEMRTNYFENTK